MQKDHMEIILEDIRGKFDLVLEGQDGLNKKIEGVKQELNERFEYNTFLIQGLNKKIDNVNESLNKKIDEVDARLGKKIDAVASDLAAHRADTESHGLGSCRVSEK
jgi:hypothetical protein